MNSISKSWANIESNWTAPASFENEENICTSLNKTDREEVGEGIEKIESKTSQMRQVAGKVAGYAFVIIGFAAVFSAIAIGFAQPFQGGIFSNTNLIGDNIEHLELDPDNVALCSLKPPTSFQLTTKELGNSMRNLAVFYDENFKEIDKLSKKEFDEKFPYKGSLDDTRFEYKRMSNLLYMESAEYGNVEAIEVIYPGMGKRHNAKRQQCDPTTGTIMSHDKARRDLSLEQHLQEVSLNLKKLADCYYHGNQGKEQNKQKALLLYDSSVFYAEKFDQEEKRRLGEPGSNIRLFNTEANNMKGIIYMEMGGPGLGSREFSYAISSRNKNVNCLYNMALFNEKEHNNTNVEADLHTSFRFYKLAAELNHIPSIEKLIQFYKGEIGITKKKFRQAKLWSSKLKTMNQGFKIHKNDLGYLYTE